MSQVKPTDAQDPKIDSLLGELGELIRQARQKVLRAVDTIQVQTCWQIGRHIVEFEQQGAQRAGYGKQLLALLMNPDKADVIEEATTNIAAMKPHPREFIRDPVILEFLGLPSAGKVRESRLEQALIDHLQGFLLELGKGFSFVARQQRISTDGDDLYIDLVFYNYLLKCFVIIDLKRGKLSAGDVGQMDMYVRMYDELKRNEGDKPTVGIILCAESNDSVARYSMLKGNEQLFASSYKTILPSEEELRAELNREQALIEERLLIQSTE
ncbi:PDDEXK nuclease domain-containing protein [Pseudomonas sp. MWU16-30322]|uniref:PDDEXK nuclease domain-containing protein n=1 Tax=Pseudomonas sp. MWU16-30322 TaxID=2878092 RepID=UPI001CFB9575|nr:PDDEXK nuclease domain-containing protein [Pseudomonas sp. MWU16-30322]